MKHLEKQYYVTNGNKFVRLVNYKYNDVINCQGYQMNTK